MDAVPADIATEAVPVLREALSNVVRHSFASSASVEVVVQRGHLFALTVEDNGGERDVGPYADSAAPGIPLIGI